MASRKTRKQQKSKPSLHEEKELEPEEKEVVAPFTPNPKSLDGVPDLSMLVYLEMKNVLYNCNYRYCKMPRKHCYTSVSTILLAINPYERLPIYGPDVINEFHDAQKKGRLPQGRPHPYGVSARSYMRMIQLRSNQSVIVCGESGAGKTETTKLLMRYLAMTAPSASTELIVEQQIIAASPILEAYGNAKTVLNNNSSRFGKFTKLLYDVPEKAREGRILGSYLETYLLEKSRVVFQANNERNYHIPYFLYHGVPKEKHNEFGIIDPQKWHYANQGGSVEVAGINDYKRYEELAQSLKLMRIDESLQGDLWSITCGIFSLGNISFKRQGDGFASIDPKSRTFLDETARLWGIDGKALEKRLTTSTMKLPGGKTVTRNIQFDDATTNRDSIAKGIYENVFLYLCERINAELYQTDEEDIKSVLFIGILDVFGFENFWINSLEQFCINFTNEKLQQFFNYHIIRSEQEEYIKESVFWKPLTVPDNLEYIQFVEDKDYGFYKLLDSACKAPQPSSEAFMQELFKRHGKRKCIKQVTKPGSGQARGKPTGTGGGNRRNRRRGGGDRFEGFEVKHFADKVSYDVSKFLVKNMEAVHPDTAKMMKKSKNILVQEIGGTGPRGRNRKSVTKVFHGGIKTLMKNLQATEPYFVRCVNPNMQKSATIWDESVVEHQLRCGGLVEALKVLKLGYPTRVPYSTLYDQYHGNVTNPLIKNMGPEAFSTALLIAFDVSEADYELGLTKIFFKPSKAAVLDTIMGQAGQPLSAEQNEKITKWVVQKRIKQMVGSTRSFLELRKRVRLARAESRWRYAGRVAALLGGTVCNHLALARKQIEERKKLQAAQAMQSFFRGSYARAQHLQRMQKVKEATKIVWTSYRRMQDRIGLQQWLDVKVEETRERNAEIERQRKLDEQRRLAQLAADERKKLVEQQKQEALQRERERLETERAKQAELEKQREMEKQARLLREQQQREREQKEADDLAKRTEIEIKKQEENSLKVQKEHKLAQKEQEHKKRQDRAAKIEQNQQTREFDEDRQRQEQVDKIYDERFPEMKHRRHSSGSRHHGNDEDAETDEEEDEYEDEEDVVWSLKEQLKNFNKIASTGQLLLKYTPNKRRKPQDRIVRVSFDNKRRPKEISWGSGSRHIDFADILYVAHGHWTPAFEVRKESLDPQLCFSVVGKQQILDVQASRKEVAELWVKGLRKMLGHSDEKSDQLAQQAKQSGNLPGSEHTKIQKRKQERKARERRDSLMKLQQDLFVMTTTTVFRNLEEERIWNIDQSVKQKFNARTMYEVALKADIPWRQWSFWIREQIVTYLREQSAFIQQPRPAMVSRPSFIAAPPQQVSPQKFIPSQAQPMYQQHLPNQPSFGGGMPVYQQPQAPMYANQNYWNVQPQAPVAMPVEPAVGAFGFGATSRVDVPQSNQQQYGGNDSEQKEAPEKGGGDEQCTLM